MSARRQIAPLAARYPISAAFLHRSETSHIEACAKRPPLSGQYYRPDALFLRKPRGRSHKRVEHRGIERVHLVRPHQPNIGDTVRDRYRDALLHENSPR